MRTTTRIALALLLLVGASMLLIGCNPNGVGIFYRLENETKTSSLSSGLPDTATVASMSLVSSVGAYYVGAGNIYETATNSTSAGATLNWTTVNPPSTLDSKTAICNQFVISGKTIYAVYGDNSTAPYLYQAQISAGSLASLTWSPVSGFGPTNTGGYDVQSVFLINGQLLVSVLYTDPTNSKYGKFALFLESNSSAPIMDSLTSVVADGTFDSADNSYWFIAGSSLYTETVSSAASPPTAALALAANTPNLGINVVYRGIYWSSIVNTLFASTSDGSIWASKSGSGKYYSIATWPSSVSTKPGLNGFAELDLSSTKDVLLIGTDTGYYVLDLDPTSFAPSSASIELGQPGNTTFDTATVNYLSSKLATANVLSFFPASNTSTTSRIFALTSLGLWRSTPTSSGREWQQG